MDENFNLATTLEQNDVIGGQEQLEDTGKFISGIIDSIIEKVCNKNRGYPCFGKDKNYAYDHLIISGGAVRGFAALGALDYCYTEGYLDNIKKYTGSSVGSMICYFLAIGIEPPEILLSLIQSNFFRDINYNWLSLANGNGLMENAWGKITSILKPYENDNTRTFRDVFHNYGIKLCFVTYNFSLRRQELLGYDTTPDLNCIDAIHMSSSLPLLFSKCMHNGDNYIDGGIINNFPLDLIMEGELGLGINLLIRNDNNNARIPNDVKFQEYLYELIMIPFDFYINKNITESLSKKNCDIINIDFDGDISAFKFDINISEQLDLYSMGYNSIKKFYTQV